MTWCTDYHRARKFYYLVHLCLLASTYEALVAQFVQLQLHRQYSQLITKHHLLHTAVQQTTVYPVQPPTEFRVHSGYQCAISRHILSDQQSQWVNRYSSRSRSTLSYRDKGVNILMTRSCEYDSWTVLLPWRQMSLFGHICHLSTAVSQAVQLSAEVSTGSSMENTAPTNTGSKDTGLSSGAAQLVSYDHKLWIDHVCQLHDNCR